jgi:hypothetical protein
VFSIGAMGAWIVVLGLLGMGATHRDGPMYSMGASVVHDDRPYTVVAITSYMCTRADGTYEEGYEYECANEYGTLTFDESDVASYEE